MSRPKYYWFGFIQRTLERYPDQLIKDDTAMSKIALVNIRKALEQTRHIRDGEDRVKLAEMLYFKRSHTIDGAAMKLHVSTRTAQQWNSDLIYLIADKMGFL